MFHYHTFRDRCYSLKLLCTIYSIFPTCTSSRPIACIGWWETETHKAVCKSSSGINRDTFAASCRSLTEVTSVQRGLVGTAKSGRPWKELYRGYNKLSLSFCHSLPYLLEDWWRQWQTHWLIRNVPWFLSNNHFLDIRRHLNSCRSYFSWHLEDCSC